MAKSNSEIKYTVA